MTLWPIPVSAAKMVQMRQDVKEVLIPIALVPGLGSETVDASRGVHVPTSIQDLLIPSMSRSDLQVRPMLWLCSPIVLLA